MDSAQRYERERVFHDTAFGEGTRAAAAKYYSVTRASALRYSQLLDSAGPGDRVLEYGCGPGGEAFRLARRGADVTGIDLSPEAIRQARARAEREGLQMTFLEMNAERLDFPDDTFDLIFGNSIIHHLDLEAAFSEVARTLKRDGRAVFIEPLGHNPVINLYRRATPRLRTPDEHPLVIADLELARRYFEDVDASFFHLVGLAAFPLRRLPVFDRVVGALDRLDARLFRSVPRLQKHAWRAVIELAGPNKA